MILCSRSAHRRGGVAGDQAEAFFRGILVHGGDPRDTRAGAAANLLKFPERLAGFEPQRDRSRFRDVGDERCQASIELAIARAFLEAAATRAAVVATFTRTI